MISWLRIAFLIGLALCVMKASSAQASSVNNDFLIGVGDFEQSTFVRWFAFGGTGYDPATDPDVLYYYSSSPLISGYSKPTPDDSVGDGWIRTTGRGVDPKKNAIFRVVKNPQIGSGNCQFIEIRDMAKGTGEISLDNHIPVSNAKSFQLHSGDTVTFRIDRIAMTDYVGLLPGQTRGGQVSFYMSMGDLAPAKELKASTTPFSDEITAVIPASANQVSLQVYILTSGNLYGKHPGIYLDGAHLYVKRAGSSEYERREVPVVPNRRIRTHQIFFNPAWTDMYVAARDSDIIALHEDKYPEIRALRILNPDIKIYLYQSGSFCLDRRDSAGRDEIFNSAPFTYKELLKDHPNWLYASSSGAAHDPEATEKYHLRIENPEYEMQSVQRIIDMAKKLGVDGVWLDDVGALKAYRYGADRSPNQVQKYDHSVCPMFKKAGLTVVQNACAQNLQNVPDLMGNNGVVYFDPSWMPSGAYTAAKGYGPNSPDSVPDVMFQEWAFLMKVDETRNAYDRAYWYHCLQDMDTVREWNTRTDSSGKPLLSQDRKRYIHLYVQARDLPNDPAYGPDGWINFGLCSYLLGQNDWTYFGARIEGPKQGVNAIPYPDIDYSITQKLGSPDGDHRAYKDDKYCRYRLYRAAPDGGVGGVVIVNANTGNDASYIIGFDAIDQTGVKISAGTVITLKPHTGRILLRAAK